MPHKVLKIGKLLTALLLAVVCVLAPLGEYTAAAAENTAPTKADFQEELELLGTQLKEIQKQKDALKEQIESTKDEQQKKVQEKTSWERQIQVTRDEIALLEERISILEGRVSEKEQEITLKELDIEQNFTEYKKRMRAIYMAGEASAIEMVLGAADYTDLLMRTELVRTSAQRDKELLGDLRTDRMTLESARQDLGRSMEALSVESQLVEEKRQEYEHELNQTQEELQDIELLQEQYLREKQKMDEQDKKMQAEIDKIYAQIETTAEYVGGEFAWPVPGFSKITSYYGWRFNNTNFHTGMDIAGKNIFGASVRASNSGKVVYTQSAYVPGVGYGRHVIVDHGGGYSSIYAHLTSISVKVGDSVVREVTEVGKVGSTGWSTGPHLHFEIRINGKHQNPLTLLKG